MMAEDARGGEGDRGLGDDTHVCGMSNLGYTIGSSELQLRWDLDMDSESHVPVGGHGSHSMSESTQRE